jgi:predicted nucleotidyltransferase
MRRIPTVAVATTLQPPCWTADQILCILRAHRTELRQMGVRRIGLFGSFRHDHSDEESDIDLLVKLAHPSFDRYMAVRFYLEDLLGRDVDLVLENGLTPEALGTILPDAMVIDSI